VLQGFLAEAQLSAPRVLYSEHFEDGAALFAQAAKLGLEGVVSKRADAPYRSGRGEHWHKTKCWQVRRFVVVGFAPDGMGGLAKLRLARPEGGKLVYRACTKNEAAPRNIADARSLSLLAGLVMVTRWNRQSAH
jgi:ATP-dependent DNA ligase